MIKMRWIFALVFAISGCMDQPAGQAEWAIVIHGGAGSITPENTTPEQEARYKKSLDSALQRGIKLLKSDKTALEVVTEVITLLEDDSLFNAGKGAVLTNAGRAELDASLMDGATLNAGAVAGVTNVKNPILLAHDVMRHSPHVMLAGKGAEEFAKSRDHILVDNGYFVTRRRRVQWQKMQDNVKGTVGVVALDRAGNLAAGTSTGGMTNKKFGRIGDSPIIGAGTYANNKTCAVSCTGHGEFFIRLAVASRISAQMQYGHKSLKDAATEVIHTELQSLGGSGGIIALDRQGNIATVFNTKGMYRAYASSDQPAVIAIFDK
jgi:beta-aspartyl-peptidase (threonine type)